MRVDKIISDKLQTLLGSKYKIFADTFFNKNYTEAREVREGENVGYARFYNNDYARLRKEFIIGRVSVSNPTRSNSSAYYVSSSIKIEFSVPRNIIKTTKNDIQLEPAPFSFDDDIEALISTITNATIQFNETYKGKMSLSEPTYIMTEEDGEYQYDIMQMNGSVVVTDNAKFGSEYKVELGINGAYVELDGVTSFTEMMNTDGNAIPVENKAKMEQNMSALSWTCSISIDDIQTNNTARQLLYNIVHENREIINANAVNEAVKRKVRVRITSPYTNVHVFNAIPSITFTSSRNSIGNYAISFTDDNKDYTQHMLRFNSSGGESVASKIVYEGQEIGTLPIPGKTGYTFNGWKIGDTTITAETVYNYIDDEIAVAEWTPITYYVDFYGNGGTGTAQRQTFVYGQEQTLNANPFTRGSAEFWGWASNDAQFVAEYTDEQSVVNLTSVENGVVSLYAVWENYTLTFDNGGGSKQVIKGTSIGELPSFANKHVVWTMGGHIITASTTYTWTENKTANANLYEEKWVFNDTPEYFTDQTFNVDFFYIGGNSNVENQTAVEFRTYEQGGTNSILYYPEADGYVNSWAYPYFKEVYFANAVDTTGDASTFGYWLSRDAVRTEW